MSNLNVMSLRAPMRGEQVGDKAAVTLFRAGFGAKKRCVLRPGSCFERLRDSALSHKGKKTGFVGSPVLRITIGVEQFSSWRELWFVGIAYARHFVEEERQVGIFCEAGELSAAIEADIDKFFHLGILQKAEKLFGRFSREADSAKKNRHRIRNTR